MMMELSAYETMVLIRSLETELQRLCDSGECRADLHFSTGQEAIPVGVISALRETDYVVSHHRTIAHALAKGVPLQALVDELLGRSDGLSQGWAGEMHLSSPEQRFMFTWQLVATCVPVAAGLAWAVERQQKTDDIVVCFHGDAATANGQWHEGMNLAAVQGLPLLLICENNRLAGNVGPEHYQPVLEVEDRASGYGVRHLKIDGNNLELVRIAAGNVADYVRRERKPFFLQCDTVRLGRHKQGMGDLRTREQLAELWKLDPIAREAQRLGLSPEEMVRVQFQAFNRAMAALTPSL